MIAISSELARSALDAAPDAMVIIAESGAIKYVNRQVAVLFGYAHDDIIGLDIEKLMPSRFSLRHVKHRSHYAENVRVRPMGSGLDLFGRRRDGTEFPIEISLSPIEDGEQTLIAAAIRDVSSQKAVEAELMVARDTAKALQALADRASLGKSRFLATASHDLRQPLQALAMLNGTLRRMPVAPALVDVFMQQDQAISAMSRLLNALLDISKLESGAIKPDPSDFTVNVMFDELRIEFGSLADDKGLSLEILAGLDPVRSDQALLEQILRNLLANALKYTHRGSVRVHCVQVAGFVRIEVVDTGIGISKEQLALIYDEFYQVGVPANSTRDGYGLGLTIVSRLVALLALTLEVSSELGRGTTFSLLIPAGLAAIADERAESPAARIGSDRVVGSVRVLLVEDDLAVRRATRMLLELEGYHVTAVSSLPEALHHVRSGNAVDLLVSDYHLKHGVTGIHVIDALRSILGIKLPVVLSTGDTSSVIKQLPRDPYLRVTSKPVKAEELLTLLPALLAV